MSNVVAIGYRDDILPFGVWGIQLMPIASTHELVPTLDRVLQARPERSEGTPSLIIVSEAVVNDSPSALGGLKSWMAKSPVPILVLPTHRGSYGTGLRETAALIKTAIGIDILEGTEGES